MSMSHCKDASRAACRDWDRIVLLLPGQNTFSSLAVEPTDQFSGRLRATSESLLTWQFHFYWIAFFAATLHMIQEAYFQLTKLLM